MSSVSRSPAWLGAAGVVALGIVASALFVTRTRPEPIASGCVACHADQPPGAHAAVACTACHLGDAFATTQEAAHVGLEAEAGALDTVDRTCGGCHPAAVATVRALPMTTGRGLVGVDKFVFGELPTPDTEQTLGQVLAATAPTPAEDHLRKLCAGCHLGTRRGNRDDAVQGGSGCAACHAAPSVSGHSTVDADVADARCQGCHSRSSRISLTYAGLAEMACDAPVVSLPDGRDLCAIEPDVHAAAGLGCIDCHVHTELMGDGVSRAHQEEQVEVRCESCHAPVAARWGDVADAVSLRVGRARQEDDVVATATRGTPLWNVTAREGAWRLSGKADGDEHDVTMVPPGHGGPGHDRLTCVACHAAVAPTCPDCHTSRDPDGTQWDFGRGEVTAGRWVETGRGGVAPPALGVGADGRIRPAIPGMIATIGAIGEVRRFALLDPHATRRTSRSCIACHREPAALGLGTGLLELETLRFTPALRVADQPALAVDGWTTLLPDEPALGTRRGNRSFDATEQRRVLRVGVCLSCHETAADPLWTALPAPGAPRPAACSVPTGWWDDPL